MVLCQVSKRPEGVWLHSQSGFVLAWCLLPTLSSCSQGRPWHPL